MPNKSVKQIQLAWKSHESRPLVRFPGSRAQRAPVKPDALSILVSDKGLCQRQSMALHLILYPGIFDGLSSLFGRRVARSNLCADIVESSARVGTKQLIHCDRDPVRV